MTGTVTFRMSAQELDAMKAAMAKEGVKNTSEFVRRAIMHMMKKEGCAWLTS